MHERWYFAVLQHFLHDFRMLQEHIPDLEAAHLKVEAPAHCLVNGDNAVSYFGGEVRRVDQRVRCCLAGQLCRRGHRHSERSTSA